MERPPAQISERPGRILALSLTLGRIWDEALGWTRKQLLPPRRQESALRTVCGYCPSWTLWRLDIPPTVRRDEPGLCRCGTYENPLATTDISCYRLTRAPAKSYGRSHFSAQTGTCCGPEPLNYFDLEDPAQVERRPRPDGSRPRSTRQGFGVTNSISCLAVMTRVRPHAAGKCWMLPVTR